MRILDAQIDKITRRMKEQKNIDFYIEDDAFAALSDAALADLSNGGRGIGNQVESLLINPLSRWLFDEGVLADADVLVEQFDVQAKPPRIVCRLVEENANEEA